MIYHLSWAFPIAQLDLSFVHSDVRLVVEPLSKVEVAGLPVGEFKVNREVSVAENK